MSDERAVPFSGNLSQNAKPGFGLRAAIVGSIATAVGCWIAVRSSVLHNVSGLGVAYFPQAAGMVFVVLLFAVNPLLRVFGGKWTLTRAELLLALSMLLMGVSLSTLGFAQVFLPNLMGPAYFANRSNEWWTELYRFGPLWAYPRDAHAIQWFWEGMPGGNGIPWGTFIAPFVFWGVMALALYGMMFALTAMLRKQWVVNERLIFPLMEPPLILLEGRDQGRLLPPVCRTRMFWTGFSIVILVAMTTLIEHLNPNVSSLRIFSSPIGKLKFSHTWTEMPLRVTPLVIGFAYFVKRDVLLSLWLFATLSFLERNILTDVGYSSGTGVVGEFHTVANSWQGMGALLVYIGASLFVARGHLRAVFRKALTGDPAIDDSDEAMSYRAMVLMFAIGFLIVLVFLLKLQLAFPVALTLMVFYILIHLAAARFACEGGTLWARMPTAVFVAPIVIFGATNLSRESLAALAAIIGLFGTVRCSYAAGAAQSMKLDEAGGFRGGALLKAAALAVIVSLVVSTLLTLAYCYDKGALNTGTWALRNGGRHYFSGILGSVKQCPEPSQTRFMWAGIGGAIMSVLVIGRYWFAWWPIHPIGMPIAIGMETESFAFSVFIAWLVKTVLVRLGGVPLYARCKPLFVGFIVASLSAMTLAFTIAAVRGQPGIPLP